MIGQKYMSLLLWSTRLKKLSVSKAPANCCMYIDYNGFKQD